MAGDVASLTVSNSTFLNNGPLPVEDEETGEAKVTSIGGAISIVGCQNSATSPINLTVVTSR